MSKHKKYTPKHRTARKSPGASVSQVAKSGIRTSVVFSSVAVAATGIAVGSGVATSSSAENGANFATVATDLSAVIPKTADTTPAAAESTATEKRAPQVSRSADRRSSSDPVKAAELAAPTATSNGVARTEDATDDDPREIAKSLLPEFGFGPEQFSCLDKLYVSESDWRINADNPSSSAYGIPQALPGNKMASAGADWETNPVTQIRWGLGYIEDRYGTPCNAWSFKQGNNWY
ncbi:hypothetical protein BJ980_001349 [Nocardioides daedukensis]|uniref:Lytic transglycosylase domain-containing protein n=1 Tax=Nocardioides daedukensis TaxID=634462 RepID=A0A7Y9RZN4_9ACTN|nr:lytic transglycosylase domain-containing protein [Nocardioides daedukensis]NYG58426.1 hypothetical protein [Nocardioides daedukensis]